MSDLYKEYLQCCTKKNSMHFSLSFRSGMTREEMQPLIGQFLNKLVEKAGIHPGRLAMVGLLMMKPDSHGHIVCISDRDRKTGRSITNMTLQAVQELFSWWEGVAGSTAKSRHVWSAKGLLDYQAGWKNIMQPGQQWAKLPVYGEKFIDRLKERQQRRVSQCQA